MNVSTLLKSGLAGLLLLLGTSGSFADSSDTASYVISLGGTNIANANFSFDVTGSSYTLALNATVSGVAQLVASGTVKANSAGTVTATGLAANAFELLTSSSGGEFTDKVSYSKGDVKTFVVNPPITNNLNRIPLERKQLHGVNDMLAPFILKGSKLDRSLCDRHPQIFSGLERFDLAFRYAKDDVATSPRTGYQGPVVLCHIQYKPISGHYTTSELTNSLAQNDRILIWYAPLKNTGFFIPYRVLLSTSSGDLSMVLTSIGG